MNFFLLKLTNILKKMNDAIPICRSVEKHWVFEDAEYFKLWYCILSNTQYTVPARKKVYQGIMYTQHRGEFLFGRREWSRRYGVSEQRIRKFMDLLVADGMVVRTQLTRKFSIYRVVNYDKFNPLKKPVDADVVPPTEPTETPQTTHEKPTDNPQTTTIKKDKIVKKDKNNYTDDFEEFMSAYPKQDEKSRAFTNWKSRMREKVDPQDLIAAAKKYAKNVVGRDSQFIKLASNFIGREKMYLDYVGTERVVEVALDPYHPDSPRQKQIAASLEAARLENEKAKRRLGL